MAKRRPRRRQSIAAELRRSTARPRRAPKRKGKPSTGPLTRPAAEPMNPAGVQNPHGGGKPSPASQTGSAVGEAIGAAATANSQGASTQQIKNVVSSTFQTAAQGRGESNTTASSTNLSRGPYTSPATPDARMILSGATTQDGYEASLPVRRTAQALTRRVSQAAERAPAKVKVESAPTSTEIKRTGTALGKLLSEIAAEPPAQRAGRTVAEILTGKKGVNRPVPQTVPAKNNTQRPQGQPGRITSVTRQKQQPKGKRKKVGVAVPSIVPPQYRKAVAKHGQRLNQALEEAGINMTGPEYLARLIEFESGWEETAENPSSAYGFGQFIDSTAADFRNRLGVETQDPSRPRQMIKGASMHASGKYGYGALYPGYNPGYSDTDPIPAVPAGENVEVKVNRKALERVAEGGVATGEAPEKAPGPYAGSKAIIRELIGPYAKTEDWKDKEDRGDPGGTFHDIGTEDAYAADLSADEAIVDRIAKKLGLDPDEVNYGTAGLESGITYKGYEIEFLPYTHGSGPHVHIGARWTGESAPPGTTFGGTATGSSGAGLTGGSSGAIPTATKEAAAAKKRAQRGFVGAASFTRSPLAARATLAQGSLAAADRAAEEEESGLYDPLPRYAPKRRR